MIATSHPIAALDLFEKDSRGWRIARRLCSYYPSSVSSRDLMDAGGIYPKAIGPVSAAASLYCAIERVNHVLRRAALCVVEKERGKFVLRRGAA